MMARPARPLTRLTADDACEEIGGRNEVSAAPQPQAVEPDELALTTPEASQLAPACYPDKAVSRRDVARSLPKTCVYG